MTAEALQDLEDTICDALQDSMDVDWTCRTGARHIVKALIKGGVAPLSLLPMSDLLSVCSDEQNPQCEEARAIYEDRQRAADAAYERRAETFGTPECCKRYDAEKRALAEWRS